MVANFGHFQEPVIFQILGIFWSSFFAQNISSVILEWFFSCFCEFLIFDPGPPFCKGYRVCMVANFGLFPKPVIFRILAIFEAIFCTEQL